MSESGSEFTRRSDVTGKLTSENGRLFGIQLPNGRQQVTLLWLRGVAIPLAFDFAVEYLRIVSKTRRA